MSNFLSVQIFFTNVDFKLNILDKVALSFNHWLLNFSFKILKGPDVFIF